MENYIYVVYVGKSKDGLMYTRVYKAKEIDDDYCCVFINDKSLKIELFNLFIVLDSQKVEELMKKFPIGCKVKHKDGKIFTIACYNYSNGQFWLSPGIRQCDGYCLNLVERIDIENPELSNGAYQYFFSAQELNGEKEVLTNFNPFFNVIEKLDIFKKIGCDLISYKVISKLDTPGILAFFKKV